MSSNVQTDKKTQYQSDIQPSGPLWTKPLVLVVENHEDTRFMLRMLLEMRGCRVAEAWDGVEAVEIALREAPDLILMDGSLPLLDGLSATRRIRAQTQQQVKIVAISGDARPKFQMAARAAGCDACLVKPIDFGQLDAILGGLFDKRTMTA